MKRTYSSPAGKGPCGWVSVTWAHTPWAPGLLSYERGWVKCWTELVVSQPGSPWALRSFLLRNEAGLSATTGSREDQKPAYWEGGSSLCLELAARACLIQARGCRGVDL